MNKHYRVTMTELRNGMTQTIIQNAYVPSKEDVIKIYGLHEPDILNYKIEKVK